MKFFYIESSASQLYRHTPDTFYNFFLCIPWIARRAIIGLAVATFGVRTVVSDDGRWGTVSVTTSSRAILFSRVLSRCAAVTAYMTAPAILKGTFRSMNSGYHRPLQDRFMFQLYAYLYYRRWLAAMRAMPRWPTGIPCGGSMAQFARAWRFLRPTPGW